MKATFLNLDFSNKWIWNCTCIFTPNRLHHLSICKNTHIRCNGIYTMLFTCVYRTLTTTTTTTTTPLWSGRWMIVARWPVAIRCRMSCTPCAGTRRSIGSNKKMGQRYNQNLVNRPTSIIGPPPNRWWVRGGGGGYTDKNRPDHSSQRNGKTFPSSQLIMLFPVQGE